MTKWQTTTETCGRGESRYSALRRMCAEGWEPWHLDIKDSGWCEIYFKRPATEFSDGENGNDPAATQQKD